MARDLESSEGLIHLLVRIDHMDDAPKEQERGKNIVLYRSVFGTGHMVCRNMISSDLPCTGSTNQAEPQKMLSCKSVLFNPLEFIPSEAMGMELPRSCPACKTARSANFAWTPFHSRRIPNMK
jgi:hypothetical protein